MLKSVNRIHPLKRFYAIIDNADIEYKINNIPEFPRIIELEITNMCNFRCSMCKTGNGSSTRKKGSMSIEIYEKLIDEIRGHDIALKFVGQGESLLNTKFLEFVKIAKKENIVCHLTTNGSMLSEELMRELVLIHFDSIKFSFQGVNGEGYYTLRGKNDFNKLLKKIERLKEIRGEEKYPFITICTSVTNETQEEINNFKKMASNIADQVEVGTTTLEFLNEKMINDEMEREKLLKLKKVQTMNKVRYAICNQVFDVLTVRWDGSISACCADNDGIMVCGNLTENSLEEVWNCDKIKRYRKILAKNEYEKLPLCRNCYDYMGYMNSNNKR